MSDDTKRIIPKADLRDVRELLWSINKGYGQSGGFWLPAYTIHTDRSCGCSECVR